MSTYNKSMTVYVGEMVKYLDIASVTWQCRRACARSSCGRGAGAGAARAKHTSATLAARTPDSVDMQRGMRDSDTRREAVCSWRQRKEC